MLRQFTIREGGNAKLDMLEYNGEFIFGFDFNEKSRLYADRFLSLLGAYGMEGALCADLTLPEEIE